MIWKDKIDIKDVLEKLSRLSIKILTEALNLKRYGVIVINNCKPHLVEHRKRIIEDEMIRLVVGCDQ
ncbi:TPA: hypothetical protein QCO67_005755 [Bacillus cereus]|nr:hypothetical protein [Bacillus cereus]HDR3910835.1 hypothetical protein [Bacillus cereus]HDR3914926.1 hypothetical protein [Bacillus cereus]HDV7169659.1 hypothetical protein [Bacillus cereus]